MPASHATPTDLEAYLSATGWATVDAWTAGEITRWLDRCSDIVDDLTGRANYSTDANGLATDPDLAEALSKATCAVVELWLAVGEDNDIDGLAAEQISVTGFTGKRAPEATRRVLRPLKRAGLLCQPGSYSNGEVSL